MKLLLQLSHRAKLFLGLLLFYIVLTFTLPASDVTKAAYNLSDAEYYKLLFSVRLPIIISWCLVFYSYTWLRRYAQKLSNSPEGLDFKNIALGVQWVAWGFIGPALAASSLSAVANIHHHFLSTALITSGYVYSIVPIVAFTYMAKGSHSLALKAKVKLSSNHIQALILCLVMFSVLFCYLVSLKLNGDSLGDSYNAYYLPNWLIWTTLVIPYLYAAFIGLSACFELVLTARQTPGIIYKRGLQYLAIGLVLNIIGLSALQYYRTIVPRTGHLVIGPTLITTYVIYVLIAIGSITLLIGAKRLKRIEDA